MFIIKVFIWNSLKCYLYSCLYDTNIIFLAFSKFFISPYIFSGSLVPCFVWTHSKKKSMALWLKLKCFQTSLEYSKYLHFISQQDLKFFKSLGFSPTLGNLLTYTRVTFHSYLCFQLVLPESCIYSLEQRDILILSLAECQAAFNRLRINDS